MRIGHGYDVHRLVEQRKLILGGVEIPFEKGLLGHSDADVLTHAVMDAVLGAAALGITVLCIKGVRSGCGYAYSQGVQHGADIAVPGFAVIEKRERHTAVGRVPENGKTRYQGRQRPDGTLDRE